MMQQITHCCQSMTLFVNDQRIRVNYSLKVREYSIYLMYSRMAQQQMVYCPWCGYKLPNDLRDEYLSILEKEYNLDNPFGEEQEKLIPKEFKSDEWWKKRGL